MKQLEQDGLSICKTCPDKQTYRDNGKTYYCYCEHFWCCERALRLGIKKGKQEKAEGMIKNETVDNRRNGIS